MTCARTVWVGVAVFAALTGAWACGVEPVTGKETATCPAPAQGLRLDQIQMLGSHASYHVAQPVPKSKLWAGTHAPLSTQLESQGVRAFDLDVHYVPGTDVFAVANRPGLDGGTTCATLRQCLGALWAWSEANPCHHTLVVRIGNGDDIDPVRVADHVAELDDAIVSAWPRRWLLQPDDVRGEAATLREALQDGGWPALDTTRGRLAVVLSSAPDVGAAYLKLHPRLEGAPAFVTGAPGDDDVAVVFPVGLSWAQVRGIVEKRYLVGVFPSPSSADGDAALASGAHVVLTDAPTPRDWLGGYSLSLPGGNPSRCNPVTAPTTCTTGQVNGPLGAP